MKISALTIYLINLCDNLRIIAISCAILPVLLVVVLIVSAALADDELDPAWMKRVGIGFAISMFFLAVLPSQKTLAAMIVIPAITNNEQCQKIPEDVLRWAENYIHEHLEEQKRRDAK